MVHKKNKVSYFFIPATTACFSNTIQHTQKGFLNLSIHIVSSQHFISIYHKKSETKQNIYLYCFHLLNLSQQSKIPENQRQIYVHTKYFNSKEFNSYITYE